MKYNFFLKCLWPADNIEDYSTSLRYAEQTVIPNSQCEDLYKHISDDKICVSNYGAGSPCKGDSGGPLLRKHVNGWASNVIGIASSGYPVAKDNGYPVVYTRVTSHLKWIKMNSGVYYH